MSSTKIHELDTTKPEKFTSEELEELRNGYYTLNEIASPTDKMKIFINKQIDKINTILKSRSHNSFSSNS